MLTCVCSGDNGAGFVYNVTEKNLLPFYLDTIRENKLRVLVYNGDAGAVHMQGSATSLSLCVCFLSVSLFLLSPR